MCTTECMKVSLVTVTCVTYHMMAARESSMVRQMTRIDPMVAGLPSVKRKVND